VFIIQFCIFAHLAAHILQRKIRYVNKLATTLIVVAEFFLSLLISEQRGMVLTD
jgi:hypothetical protein